MAANDGPIPVRTLAHAARLMRGMAQLERYGIAANKPVLSYSKLLARVSEVVTTVRGLTSLRGEVDRLGVSVREGIGPARFVDGHTVETGSGLQFTADRFILCTGGVPRRLTVSGAELTPTPSDAWGLTEAPRRLLVVGGGMTGLQVASIFRAFGSEVRIFQRGPRILPDEDEDVATTVAAALRESGIDVQEGFGAIESFEKTS